MTYIDRMNTFNLSLLEKPVSPNARALYYYLLHFNNSLGWRETFSIANIVLASSSGLSEQQMYRARTELINNGYIKYKKPKHSSLTGIYQVLQLFDYQNNIKNDNQTEVKPKSNRSQNEVNSITLNRLDKTRLDKSKKEIDKEKEPHTLKNSFGEFKNVKLTEQEYKNLIIDYGELKANEFITRLDNYIESTGKRYKSHYATILNWIRKEQADKKQSGKVKKTRFEDIQEMYD